jgi:hypothetical protein
MGNAMRNARSRRSVLDARALMRHPRHCEEPTGPARSGRPDDKLRDEAIQNAWDSRWIASLRSQ